MYLLFALVLLAEFELAFDCRIRWRSAMGRSNCGLVAGRASVGHSFMLGRRIVVLHAFVKNTQQTPDRELKLVRRRLKELQDG